MENGTNPTAEGAGRNEGKVIMWTWKHLLIIALLCTGLSGCASWPPDLSAYDLRVCQPYALSRGMWSVSCFGGGQPASQGLVLAPW
jgi:hypothetical protein